MNIIFFLREEYVKRLKRILKELKMYEMDGIDSIIFEIENIGELGFYELIYDAFYQGNGKLLPSTKNGKEKYLLSGDYMGFDFQKMGLNQLSRPPLPIPIITDLISFPIFFCMYPFLESVYFVNVDKILDSTDIKLLYATKIDERLAYYLDEFDTILEFPEMREDFFINLKQVKWKNGNSKRLFGKLKEALKCVRMEMFGKFHILFSNTERDFLLFLAACSALKNDSNRINQEDVIIASVEGFVFIYLIYTVQKPNNAHETVNCIIKNNYSTNTQNRKKIKKTNPLPTKI